MTTKEKVIREAARKALKRSYEIGVLLNARPLHRILEIRKEASDLLQGQSPPFSPAITKKIKKLAVEEKKQIKIADKQMDSVALIEEQVSLHHEIQDLNLELYRMGVELIKTVAQ